MAVVEEAMPEAMVVDVKEVVALEAVAMATAALGEVAPEAVV